MGRHLVWLVVLAGAILAGCSGSVSVGDSPQKAATRLIETDIQTQLGLGTLTVSCPEGDYKVGDEFDCSATPSSGKAVNVHVVVDEKDGGKHVTLATTNAITAENAKEIAKQAAAVLSTNVGKTLPPENLDCGTTTVVVDEKAPSIVCALTDPDTGDVYDATVTLDSVANATKLDVQVAATPRPK